MLNNNNPRIEAANDFFKSNFIRSYKKNFCELPCRPDIEFGFCRNRSCRATQDRNRSKILARLYVQEQPVIVF